jgi:formamidopyrimidine-DNA glycosylase
MPELPEVETIVRGLDKLIVGLKINKVEVLDKKVFPGNPDLILNKKILNIKRRAKLLIFQLENDINLLVHLKMTGQLIYKDKSYNIAGGHQSNELYSEVPNKHTRVIFDLSNNGKLYFNDLRRFGWIKILGQQEIKKITNKEFGPEPFSKEFSEKYFTEIINQGKSANIKKILNDQKKIAGIGNMYSDEALFYAKIDPQRKAISLKNNEIKNLYVSILKVLKLGIKYEGASIKNYTNHEGKKGKMQDFFKVYGRTGKPCECGGVVKKIRLNGRGTHFCPKCQR